jgi:hypothetical protein
MSGERIMGGRECCFEDTELNLRRLFESHIVVRFLA